MGASSRIAAFQKFLLGSFIAGAFFLLPQSTSFAETTPYRSANTITTDGNPEYINLSNCSQTDGLTCDRLITPSSHANLYFSDFGDFGILDGSTMTHVRIRVTGRANVGLYTGLSPAGVAANCQSPSDLWTMWELNSGVITTYSITTSLTNGSLANCLSLDRLKTNGFVWRVNWSGVPSWYANIDNFEIAFDYTPPVTPTPTVTPTSTPSPTPTPTVAPFLDLPWNYQSKGMSFATAATAINSYFDHEYPLLSRLGALPESEEFKNTVVSYKGGQRSVNLPYSSHDGYDYGSPAKVEFKDSVFAAAAGNATLKKSDSGCGYMISIDHQNGFQTRYCHLYDKGYLVATDAAHPVGVTKGQKIGLTGFTGNVSPEGAEGSHIHFMVVQDKNEDGNFEDNIPDGIVDPFGWQSEDPDPWENYTFFYNNLQRTGSKSRYLWTKKLASVDTTIPSDGKSVDIDMHNVTFPTNANSNQPFDLKAFLTPIVAPGVIFGILGPGISISAFDALGHAITSFSNPFVLVMDFSEIDLSRYDPDTISIYSSIDGEIWTRETGTAVDLINKKATAQIDHLTQFVLMAERIDTTPPITTILLNGDSNLTGAYKSDVEVALSASDGAGLGVQYTLYRIGGVEWQEYVGPLVFSEEGNYTISYYSVDNDDNTEGVKTTSFSIDKTPPEAEVSYSVQANTVQVIGRDGSESASVVWQNSGGDKKIIVSDKAGNALTILARLLVSKPLSWMSIQSLQYNSGTVIVPDKNNFLTTPLYNSKTGKLSSIGQIYSVKDKNVIGILYTVATDKTKIYTYDKQNKELLKGEKSGMHLLQLNTERGSLKYRY